MTAKTRIFLAHASEDKGPVRDLYSKLENRGFKPWLDEINLLPGQNWQIEISKAIRESDIFIACFSRQSVRKKGYVQRELRTALSTCAERPHDSIYLIPLKLDDCEIPDLQLPQVEIRLRDFHELDYWRPGGFERLVSAIEADTGHTSAQRTFESAPTAPRVEVSIKPTVPDRLQLRCELDSEGRVNWSPLKTFASFLPFVDYFIRKSCPVFSVAFSPDGTMLAFGSEDKRVYLWEAIKQAALKTLYGHNGQVRSVTFSPDGRTLASGSTDRSVRIWRTLDGTIQRELTESRTEVSSIAFSPDGTVIASGGYDGKVRLWRIRDGKCLHIKEAHKGHLGVNNVAFRQTERFSRLPDGMRQCGFGRSGTIQNL